jgi:hypothetical protein
MFASTVVTTDNSSLHSPAVRRRELASAQPYETLSSSAPNHNVPTERYRGARLAGEGERAQSAV